MNAPPFKVLLIEDSLFDTKLIQGLLAAIPGKPFVLECAHRMDAGLEYLATEKADVVLLDMMLPDSEGLNTLLRVQAHAPPDVAIVVLTGVDDEELATAAMQAGAEDYLVKGQVSGQMLARSLRYAVERTRRRQVEAHLLTNNEQFRAARAIQQKLFPTVPELSSFDIAGMSYCAENTCGDYFDYVRMPNGCISIVIADVSGHDLAAALLMASTRAYIRGLLRTHENVGEILTIANHVLEDDIKEDRFVTLVLACLNPKTRTFVYASAGHPPAYILDPFGVVKTRLESTGPPLGILGGQVYDSGVAQVLEEGEIVLFLTDGIMEARAPDNTAFGGQRAVDIARVYRDLPALHIVDNLYYAVRAFSQESLQYDDITAIVLKVGLPL